MTLKPLITATAFALGFGAAGLANATEVTHLGGDITEDQVLAAQQAWGDALVAISNAYEAEGIDAARELAQHVIDSAYGYDMGAVLFKPTLAEAPQTFRTTPEGALAYFVGHSEEYSEDSGFALKGWQEVTIDNAAILISGDVALTMGNVSILDAEGNTTTVDKTWGYHLDDEGTLRIVLHHSSLPFSAAE
ncbi:phosphoribosyl-AMP cyclohydrolase [Billgrantia kenyensis]|uniref:Phosphoribosyl-AMP cyclohydrolase n=1 Tax=Billgrantia kenyensis TaxID=321266 RepID=A0A7W0AE42_9GAMM|nr:phosphoribosyl-AMP cyclohydrolase [Halomonas kenyensis]MBA2779289.1 phosphoribosyl-AMP cyclohydrolase [Halomonas kenyensis]MCG6660929.1 phosphoribosyl-AMP cyclohydrolase [Halomonas kenyensis]